MRLALLVAAFAKNGQRKSYVLSQSRCCEDKAISCPRNTIFAWCPLVTRWRPIVASSILRGAHFAGGPRYSAKDRRISRRSPAANLNIRKRPGPSESGGNCARLRTLRSGVNSRS